MLSTGPASGVSPAARPLSRTICSRRNAGGGAFFNPVPQDASPALQDSSCMKVNRQRQHVGDCARSPLTPPIPSAVQADNRRHNPFARHNRPSHNVTSAVAHPPAVFRHAASWQKRPSGAPFNYAEYPRSPDRPGQRRGSSRRGGSQGAAAPRRRRHAAARSGDSAVDIPRPHPQRG